MTSQNKRIFASILFVSILVVLISASFLYQAGPGDNPPPPQPPPPTGVPIDNKIVILFLVAIFYGIKKSLRIKN